MATTTLTTVRNCEIKIIHANQNQTSTVQEIKHNTEKINYITVQPLIIKEFVPGKNWSSDLPAKIRPAPITRSISNDFTRETRRTPTPTRFTTVDIGSGDFIQGEKREALGFQEEENGKTHGFPGEPEPRAHTFIENRSTSVIRNITVEFITSITVAKIITIKMSYQLLFSKTQQPYLTQDMVSKLEKTYIPPPLWVQSYNTDDTKFNSFFGGKYCYTGTTQEFIEDQELDILPIKRYMLSKSLSNAGNVLVKTATQVATQFADFLLDNISSS